MRVVVRRWKSHTGYYLQKSRFGLCFSVVLILAILIIAIVLFETKVVPYVLIMAEDQAETTVVVMVDKAISECEELNRLEYDDIIDVQTLETGEVTSVSAKTVKLNKIRSELSVSMNAMLDKFNETKVTIPLGGLLGMRFLSGVGIKIPVKYMPYGTAYADFKSSVESYDINRTYHKIYLEASATISIFVPMRKENLTVNTQVPIAETVIAGNVPDSFLNIDGLVNNEKKN